MNFHAHFHSRLYSAHFSTVALNPVHYHHLHIDHRNRSNCGHPVATMAAFGRDALLFHVYNHVVLPRNVPGRENSNLYQVESEIGRRLTNATKQLAQHAPLDDLAHLDTIRLMLSTCTAINIDGKIDKTMLIRELRQLEDRQALALHVTEQNAGLLIYHRLR